MGERGRGGGADELVARSFWLMRARADGLKVAALVQMSRTLRTLS